VLLLVGDGEDRAKLQTLAERQDIASHVRFLGNQPPSVVSRVLAATDVFVMASYTEGFSNAMVEAVASGRPLVTTDVSGSRDLIQEGLNGFIIRERSPQIFADKILDALALPDVEQVSRNLALERFSEHRLWQVLQESWLAYQDIA
jgi:glycosyltransferase involved in cell wall biosynthesis